MKKIVLAILTFSASNNINYANNCSSTAALFGPNHSIKQQQKITNQEILGLIDALPIVKEFKADITKRWGNKHTVSIRVDGYDEIKNKYRVNVGEMITGQKSITKYTFFVDGNSKKVLNPDGKTISN